MEESWTKKCFGKVVCICKKKEKSKPDDSAEGDTVLQKFFRVQQLAKLPEMKENVQKRIKIVEDSLAKERESYREWVLRRTFAIFYDNIRADSHAGALFHGLYILKRVVFVVAVFLLSEFGIGQIILFEVLSLVSLCLVCSEMPYVNRRQNVVEAFNEAMTLIIALHFYSFTREGMEPEEQSWIGWSVIGFMVLLVFVNMLLVLVEVARNAVKKHKMKQFVKQQKMSLMQPKVKKGVKRMMKRREFMAELKGADVEDDCQLESYTSQQSLNNVQASQMVELNSDVIPEEPNLLLVGVNLLEPIQEVEQEKSRWEEGTGADKWEEGTRADKWEEGTGADKWEEEKVVDKQVADDNLRLRR